MSDSQNTPPAHHAPHERPVVLLLDDRVDWTVVREMNLSVYLGAQVISFSSQADLINSLDEANPPHLIVCRSSIRGESSIKQTGAAIRARNLSIPIISLGEAGSGLAKDVVYLPDEGEAKPLLRAAARILRITPQEMALKKQGTYFEFSTKYLEFLSSSPCPIYFHKDKKIEETFAGGEDISRKKLRKLSGEVGGKFFVESFARLKFVNAFSDHVHSASLNLEKEDCSPVQRMIAVSTSLDIVAKQFQQAGVDKSILGRAGSCIAAIEKIAANSASLRVLLDDLLEAEGGYRFDHCQLITFIGFHVLKSMGWWSDYQRQVFSQAAFFHDIFLTFDEDARIHSADDLKKSGIKNPDRINLILTHAQRAARELGTIPEIEPEVVRIVLQHHGTKSGKGFAKDLTGLENLTKVFLIAEEWADYVISHSDYAGVADYEHKLLSMKAMYPDPVAHQLIQSLRSLNPDILDRDLIISAMNSELLTERLVKGDATSAGNESIVVNGGVPQEDNSLTRVKSVTQHIQEKLVKIGGGEATSLSPLSLTVKKGEPETKGSARQVRSLAGATELMLAALSGSLPKVKKILEHESGQAELRKHDSERRNCMHYAAMGGSVPVLALLLEHKAQKVLVDSKRRTPLFFAAFLNQTNAFDYLVAQGCRLNQQASDGTTIAMIAARNGNLHMLQAALKGGSRLDSTDMAGRTALDHAKAANNRSIIEFLLQQAENPR